MVCKRRCALRCKSDIFRGDSEYEEVMDGMWDVMAHMKIQFSLSHSPFDINFQLIELIVYSILTQFSLHSATSTVGYKLIWEIQLNSAYKYIYIVFMPFEVEIVFRLINFADFHQIFGLFIEN